MPQGRLHSSLSRYWSWFLVLGWFIGFAMKDDKPIVAVAVLLANAGSGGSGEAARIGGLVMKAVITDRGGK